MTSVARDPRGLPGPLAEAWRSFALTSRTLSAHLDRTLEARAGVGLVDFEILSELAGREAPVRMCDLGASVGLTRSGATRAIARLEREGLVERAPSPDDGRSVTARIRRAGRARQARAARVFAREVDSTFFSQLSDVEVRDLRESLDRVRARVAGTATCRAALAERASQSASIG